MSLLHHKAGAESANGDLEVTGAGKTFKCSIQNFNHARLKPEHTNLETGNHLFVKGFTRGLQWWLTARDSG
eukprot:1136516-Pelagomonas_calceolata.AAC.1